MECLDKIIHYSIQSLSKEAISYLKMRGLSKETVLKWKIGYIKNDQDFLEISNEQELQVLYDKGILLRRINRSPLNHYISFPMIDQYGDTIGVSGRPPLSNEEVKRLGLKKYWHSRFDKRKFLFGLNFALEPARELDEIIVVEGQFDTITASQAGILNIVSTCGTALTDDQIILLSRYASKVFVVFDNDEAGQQAFQQLKKHNKTKTALIPVSLPDSQQDGRTVKEDPDSFIKKFGANTFKQILEEAKLKYEQD